MLRELRSIAESTQKGGIVTKDEQISRLAEVIAGQQNLLNICERTQALQTKLFRDHEQRFKELNREATELMRENKRMRHAVKVARYQLVRADRAAFDKVFNANMVVKNA